MIHTAKQISGLLALRAEEVAKYLLPNGKKIGNEFCVGSINGEQGSSLKIHLVGEKAGVFCDFATNERGDLLDLWSLVRHLSIYEALKEAARWVGIGLPQFESTKALNFKKPQQQKFSTLQQSSSVFEYLTTERKLTFETLDKFKISENNRTIIFPYQRNNETILIKYLSLDRIDGKKQIRVESGCEPCLFGWQTIPKNARTITICEGEIDAMTLNQYGIPSLSVPFGAGGGDKQKWLEFEFERLAVFDEIYLCFDQDDAGQAGIAELVQRLGCHRCRIIDLPHKDANACLQAGVSKEAIQQLFQSARTLDPHELKRASSFVDQVINEFYPAQGEEPGISPPWEKAQGKILFRPDELSIWTGVNGHGKSQFLGQVILHSMKKGARVCVASLELKPKRLLMRLTRQAGALACPSEEYIRAIHDWYGDRLWMFNLVGTAKVKRLLEVFQYARQRYGVDIFVIDSLLKLDIAEDDYRAQKSFIEQLCDFKNQHNCHVHLIVHPRKGADENEIPGKLDTKGSGAISDLADNCFSIWRNKRKEEIVRLQQHGVQLDQKQLMELEKPDCLWSCDKQRNGDWEGKIGLWFDTASFQYLNNSHQRAVHFVEYYRPSINQERIYEN